jgi:hypothetical protein
MHIDVELPEEIAQRLQEEWKDLARGALAAIADHGRARARRRGAGPR